MYVCLDCGDIFASPRRFVETHGFDNPPYEETNGCPSCGGAYAPTVECDICGKYITGDYIQTIDGAMYCDGCYTIKNVEDLV